MCRSVLGYSASTQSWSELQALSASSTCTWTLDHAAGTISPSPRRMASPAQRSPPPPGTGSAACSPRPSRITRPSPQPVNTAITLTLSATGGSNLQYQYWLYNATAQTWSPLQTYSAVIVLHLDADRDRQLLCLRLRAGRPDRTGSDRYSLVHRPINRSMMKEGTTAPSGIFSGIQR